MHRLTRVFANLTFYATIVCSVVSIILIVAGLSVDFTEIEGRNISIDDDLIRVLAFAVSMGFVCFITSVLFHVRLIAFEHE